MSSETQLNPAALKALRLKLSDPHLTLAQAGDLLKELGSVIQTLLEEWIAKSEEHTTRCEPVSKTLIDNLCEPLKTLLEAELQWNPEMDEEGFMKLVGKAKLAFKSSFESLWEPGKKMLPLLEERIHNLGKEVFEKHGHSLTVTSKVEAEEVAAEGETSQEGGETEEEDCPTLDYYGEVRINPKWGGPSSSPEDGTVSKPSRLNQTRSTHSAGEQQVFEKHGHSLTVTPKVQVEKAGAIGGSDPSQEGGEIEVEVEETGAMGGSSQGGGETEVEDCPKLDHYGGGRRYPKRGIKTICYSEGDTASKRPRVNQTPAAVVPLGKGSHGSPTPNVSTVTKSVATSYPVKTESLLERYQEWKDLPDLDYYPKVSLDIGKKKERSVLFKGMEFFLISSSKTLTPKDPQNARKAYDLDSLEKEIIRRGGKVRIDFGNEQRENVFLIGNGVNKLTILHLYAVAKGINCVGYEWIEACLKRNEIVHWSYWPASVILQKDASLRGEDPVEIPTHGRKPLKGLKIFLTPDGYDLYRDYKQILEAAEAVVLKKPSTKKAKKLIPNRTEIVLCYDRSIDENLLAEANRKNVPIERPRWLIRTLVTGRMADIDVVKSKMG